MAKSRPAPDTPGTASSRSTPILVAGAIIVIALVAFSFSRALKRPAAAPPASSVSQLTIPPAAEPPSSGPSSAPALPLAVSPRGDGALPPGPSIPTTADVAPTQAQIDSVPRIQPADLLKKIESNQVTLIDVRDADSYRARHIPGALHIPLSFIAGEVPYLPKDKPIVTYCT